MNSPTEEHKYLRNLKNIKDLAYFNIFEKYIKYIFMALIKSLR